MFFPGEYTARAVKLELISSELLIPNMDARHSWMVVRSDPEHDDSMEGPFFLSLAVSKAIYQLSTTMSFGRDKCCNAI
ncbi:hypothetical protein I305_05093 [Cryptococcus gattii E566]|uniref:Uncharacterized protein n=2 Tax=Cryptococcus gattii TaxID=37769 RepID=E6RC87_CRYGW|nr:Hypothetical Protein CGB_I3110W [Cryptococcus gattii WM276]ADV24401.1 Hypothetical Protein CGB_I3110W [Cryptococcus gattii WM276]KIR76231.1 hypothetical protein I306_06766 [Cryptococcus gattii EJB2]KIY32522.1 hypothetical protein I305_05093 [Cryptococcus gattii E566]KJE02329.1 hypothetical protein I311_03917 [Cryptococcus gattii NT-10]